MKFICYCKRGNLRTCNKNREKERKKKHVDKYIGITVSLATNAIHRDVEVRRRVVSTDNGPTMDESPQKPQLSHEWTFQLADVHSTNFTRPFLPNSTVVILHLQQRIIAEHYFQFSTLILNRMIDVRSDVHSFPRIKHDEFAGTHKHSFIRFERSVLMMPKP